MIKNVFFLFCFLPKFINLYFAVSRSFAVLFYHLKVFYSKITENQLVLIHLSLSYFGTHFPAFGNKKMFHQASDPSLLDTVVYDLVKGNKNNLSVGLII